MNQIDPAPTWPTASHSLHPDSLYCLTITIVPFIDIAHSNRNEKAGRHSGKKESSSKPALEACWGFP